METAVHKAYDDRKIVVPYRLSRTVIHRDQNHIGHTVIYMNETKIIDRHLQITLRTKITTRRK